MYGVPEPLEYPLQNISPNATIVVFSGSTDALSTPPDVALLLSKLQPTGAKVIDHLLPAEHFNHMGFVIGMGTGKLLNDPTLRYLDQYTEEWI